MNKKISALILAILLGMGLAACGSKDNSDKPPKPTASEEVMPTIADIDVNELKTKVIGTEIDGVEYTFDGNNIAIENGVVRGLVAGTTTKVSARSDYGETSFNVTVHAALVGEEQRASAFVLDGDVYVKTTITYDEAFCMLDGKPFDGDGLIATGSFTFDAHAINAEGRVVLRDEDGEEVYLAVTTTENGYFAKGVAENKIRDIGEYNQTRVNFMVYVSDGAAYYYLNDKLVWHTQVSGKMRLSLGGKNAKTTVSRLSLAYNAELIADLKAKAHKTFGDNVFGVRGNDALAFADMGGNKYKKASDNYKQQWLYYDADPVFGTSYTVVGTVEMLAPGNAAEAIWQCCNRDAKLARILLKYDTANDEYYIFVDYEHNGRFYVSTTYATGVPNKFDFVYVYYNGKVTFCINDKIVAVTNSADVSAIGDLGATHFGFAGQQCDIILSNITVTIE